MSRIYFKVFLSFWLVTILVIVGSSLAIHWFHWGPDKHLTAQSSKDGPGGRLLREIVSDAVNHTESEVKAGISSMPTWAINYLYMIDDKGVDILNRDIPIDIKNFLNKIPTETPYFRKKKGDVIYYGRRFQLADGKMVTLITAPPIEKIFVWKLFFSNLGIFFLTSILVSGAACFYLARYITRDFRILKNATMRLGQGDWSIRISDEFCSTRSEMAELAASFDFMADNLQQSMLEQKRLIKDVSHELRSPLARLQVALAIAQQKANNDISDELDRIKNAADYLNDIISNILSLPFNEQENWQLSDTIEVNSMVQMVIDQNQAEADTKSIKLQFTSQVTEALILSRSNSLVGVFDNIVRNSLHYTPADSHITVDITLKDAKHIIISFKDEGPGVPDSDLKGIFEPFFRTCEARNRESGGYGLGLAIAQRIVRLHGGAIVARNHPSGGLIVAVTLPLYNDE